MNTKNKNYLDNINYLDASLPKTPGLISFSEQESNTYFFRFNDRKGKPLLYSIAFDKKAKRDAKIRLLLKNAQQKERYKTIEENGQWLITIESGNHQEIVRSKKFKSVASANKVKKELLGTLRNKSDKKPVADPKYAFRIDLYPRKGEHLAGVITNILSGKNKKFRGVDTPIVNNFMKQELNEIDRLLEGEVDAKKVANNKVEAIAEKTTDHTGLTEENLIIELVESTSDSINRKNWAANTPFDIRIKLRSKTKLPANGKVKMKIIFHLLQNKSIQNQMIKEVEFSEDMTAYLKGMRSLKQEGIYSLKAASVQSSLYGSTAFNVF